MIAKSSSRHSPSASSDSTVEELKALLAEAEKALASAGGQVSDEVGDIRDRLRHALSEGKAGARRAMTVAREKAACADEAIHTHPYVAIGVAAGIGALLGVLIARNHHS